MTREELDDAPVPFWPLDWVPEDGDEALEEALIADRWARLDALAGRVE